jgi:hypothetical protein
MAGFESINIDVVEEQYMNTLDSFSSISIDESNTVFITEFIPVDIQYVGVSDLSINTAIRNDTMNTQLKGITDLTIGIAIRNDTMNTQLKGITDLTVSPLPYWNPIVRSSQNYQK